MELQLLGFRPDTGLLYRSAVVGVAGDRLDVFRLLQRDVRRRRPGRRHPLTGILVDDQLALTSVGTATPLSSIGCDFTLDGTARVVGDTIQLDYTGSTCLGPISGTDVLAQF